MLTSSSRLFIHQPFTLFRLTHRHSLPPYIIVSPLPIKPSQQFHSRTAINAPQGNSRVHANAYVVKTSHPWPEWSSLVESVSTDGYGDGNGEVKDEFVPNESLSMEFVDAASFCLGFARDRPDILGWLPKKDIQVLIDDGAPFLFKSAIETERRMRSFLQEESNEATTVDLMKYVLSYASNPIIYPERSIREATESSVRNLLREMASFNSRGIGKDEQTPSSVGPNVTMKRGDWICPKCSFMNFAKNTKCLECEELRPQRLLTGSEWDCPQCNFFNYGRNMACLKCECRRPGEVRFPKTPLINSQYQINFSDNHTSNAGKDGRSSIPKGSNSGYAPFVPLPADMFAKKPEKSQKSESSIKNTSEEEKSEQWFKKVSELHDATDEDFPQIMPMRTGENRFVVSKKKDRSLTSPTYKQQQAIEQGSTSNFVPFVPFPPDYFAKKEDKQQPKITTKGTNLEKRTQNQETRILNSKPENQNPGSGWEGKKDDKRQSKITTDYTNLEKATQNQETRILNSNSSGNRNPGSGWEGKKDDKRQSKITTDYTNLEKATQNQETRISNSSENRNPGSGREGKKDDNYTNLEKATQNQETRISSSSENRNAGSGREGKKDDNYTNLEKATQNQETRILNSKSSGTENQNPGSGWEGKMSLEGSAVKETETDPLDMSEEAKAERWFRRVAQIKDISELSQIPDEDFPSIMPMRKGVNRFVVSKRKSPLERRLTSPQYRKNLQKEGDSS